MKSAAALVFRQWEDQQSQDFWKQIESLMDRMKASPTDQSVRDFLEGLPDDEETARAKAMVTRYVEGFQAAESIASGFAA